MTATLNTPATLSIGKQAALDLLESAIAQRGEQFRYTDLFGDRCDFGYTALPLGVEIDEQQDPVSAAEAVITDSVPGCIVGVGLAARHLDATRLFEIGSPLPSLAGFLTVDGYDNFRLREEPASYFAGAELVECEGELAGVGIEFTENATRVLWAAQVVQDADAPWWQARELACAVAELLVGD